MIDIFSKKYIRFWIVSLIYILIVIWIGNYWLLLGLGIIFDMYVTEKINWTFWKKRNGKNNAFIEWLDALIFAVIAFKAVLGLIFRNFEMEGIIYGTTIPTWLGPIFLPLAFLLIIFRVLQCAATDIQDYKAGEPLKLQASVTIDV